MKPITNSASKRINLVMLTIVSPRLLPYKSSYIGVNKGCVLLMTISNECIPIFLYYFCKSPTCLSL